MRNYSVRKAVGRSSCKWLAAVHAEQAASSLWCIVLLQQILQLISRSSAKHSIFLEKHCFLYVSSATWRQSRIILFIGHKNSCKYIVSAVITGCPMAFTVKAMCVYGGNLLFHCFQENAKWACDCMAQYVRSAAPTLLGTNLTDMIETNKSFIRSLEMSP